MGLHVSIGILIPPSVQIHHLMALLNRYNGRRDVWKSHWARKHQHEGPPPDHKFDGLGVCLMRRATDPPAPSLVADVATPINVNTAGNLAWNFASNDSQLPSAPRTPVTSTSFGIQTDVGQFGPAATDLSTPFYPSADFSWPTFYNQGPSMLAMSQGFLQPTPIFDLVGMGPWPTGTEEVQSFWKEVSGGFPGALPQRLIF
jgi:hypothetical protein